MKNKEDKWSLIHFKDHKEQETTSDDYKKYILGEFILPQPSHR